MNQNASDGTLCASGLDALDLPTLKTMLDASVDSILVIDGHGLIRAYNQAVLRDFGYGGEELLGRNISMLMPQPYRDQHDGYLENYQRTGERKIIGIGREVTGQRKDGSRFPLHLSVGEFRADGERYFFGICHDISEHQALTERILHMATHDSLTGCINRHQVAVQLDHIASTQTPAAVLFIDLDGFKAINDNHGHPVGDLLLEQVAHRLRGQLGDDDLLGRMGGDEFIVGLLHERGNVAGARCVAEAMVRALDMPFQIMDATVMVGASIGISLFPEHGQTAEELIRNADLAMYHIKESRHEQGSDSDGGQGSGRIHVFDQQLHERSIQRHALLVRLQQAMAGDELELYYQPQFNLGTLRPSGLEALLRWNDGTRMVMPGEFIPLAYKHGLMPALNSWVLRRACTDAKALHDAGLLHMPVAVNVSAHSINDLYFIQRVADALHDHRLPAQLLELEVTEDMAVDFSPQAQRNIAALRDMGVALVMDDYGVGFSSLIHLRRLNFSKLKLDRSFVSALPTSEDASIVRTTLALGHELNLPIVAEGIETREQLDFLREHGCQMGQGYWFARPMPLQELRAWLAANAPHSP